MKGRIRRLVRKEKPAEEATPFFRRKSHQLRENASPTLFLSAGIQSKPKIGKAGDASEKQADSVADKVVNNSSCSGLKQGDSFDNSSIRKADEKEEASAKFEVQKKEEEEPSAKFETQKQEEEEAAAKYEVQKKEEEEPAAKFETQKQEEEEPAAKLEVQKKEEEKSKSPFEQRLKAAKSSGQPLPDKVREEMEHKMGKDFSRVNIHTDDIAISLCREIKAQAFTNGYHIFFNKGKFSPGTASGKHLLAHELTHVVQQKM